MEDNLLKLIKMADKTTNNVVVSSMSTGIGFAEAYDPKSVPGWLSKATKTIGLVGMGAKMGMNSYKDVEDGESPLQAVISNGTASVAEYALGSIAVVMAATGGPIGLIAGAYILSNTDKIYQGVDELVDAAYVYADEVWKRNTGESIEETASKLAYKYGETAVATAEFQAKASLELADGLEKLFTTVKEEYKAAYDQSDIVNPLDPPPFPQTTSSLNEELYNKDKTIYEAYDLAKKSTNAMLVYNLALKQAAEHAPDTDKMRDIMYSIITEKKDCFSEGIFSVINNSEDVFNSIAANPGKYGLPDPIAIDLDGDGIETVSKEKSTAYFDLDKNGYAEKTGWISGDDALLVRDINGNSIIDDSSELFGENTALAGGGTAATGYQALSDLDSNNDGKLSSEDDAFNELKIWQDKNQDGISQADELMSLEEAGIKNISLDTVNINSGDGKGNIIEKVSKVEFEDGKVTQAGQFRFATDTLDTESTGTYTGTFEIPDEIQLLPNLDGVSNFDDLHTAMTKDDSLRALVEDYVKESDMSKLSGKFDQIMYKWFGVENVNPKSRGGNMDARQLVALEKLFQSGFNGWWNQHYRSSSVNSKTGGTLTAMYREISGRFCTAMNIQTHLREYVTLGAIEYSEGGKIKINLNIADFLLNFQQLSDELAENNEDSAEITPTYLSKLKILTNAVSLFGTESQLKEYIDHYIEKGDNYIEGLQGAASWLKIGSNTSNDSLYGSTSSEIFYGLDGNDKIYGNDGNDTIYADAGDDYISAGNGKDTVYGGEGNDEIHGGNHNDTLEGGTGNDRLYGDSNNDKIYGGEGNDYLHGGEGDDYLDGGTGNDYLYGSENNDTYIYRRGDGSDTIEEYDYHCNSHRSTDKLVLEDLNKEDIADIIREGYDVVIKFADTADVSGDQIRMKNWFRTDRGDGQYGGRYDRKLEVITFADGTKWSAGSVESHMNVYGNDSDNYMSGLYVSETYHAGAGNDEVHASNGNDILLGGEGNDKLYGDNNNDKIYGGEGNDYLHGGEGDDYLDGGTGNDYLYGSENNDTYIYRRGDGSDTIEEYDYHCNSHRSTDKLVLEDLNKEDIADIIREGYDVVIKFADTADVSGDQIRMKNWFRTDRGDGQYGGRYDRKLEVITFADGTKWSAGSVESHMDVYGNDSDNYMSGLYVSETYHAGAGNDEVHASNGNDILLGGEGNDKLYGDNNNDKIYGGEGNDYLHGGEGDDYLDGGTGNDYLYGSENNDTYIYRRGDGSDTIEEYDYHCNSHRSTDKLVLEDLNKEDIADIIREGYDVVIKFADTADVSGDQIRMKNWFRTDRGDGQYGGRYDRKLEVITFADGTKWSAGSVESHMNVYGNDSDNYMSGLYVSETYHAGAGNDEVHASNGNDILLGGEGNDKLYGDNNNDKIYGGEGNDYLHGGEGDDYLDGGTGNDYLYGSENNDTYIYRRGDGSDTIEEYDYHCNSHRSTDKLVLEDLNKEDIADIIREGYDVVIKFADTADVSGDQIRMKNWFRTDRGDGQYGGRYDRKLEVITFADGTKWSAGSVESHMNVYGNDSDNYMSGLYVSETYHAGAGNDEVHASNGNDILLGGEGNDKLYGDNNNDKIYGGEGNDYLHGGEGDDYLDGGTGNDYLYGSENNDTYIYRRGDGSDTIEEYDYHCNSHRSTDKLVLEDLNKEDIADIIREGYDVVIKFADTADVSGDQIRMKNWFRTDRGDGQYGGRYDRKLEVITFADGTKWSAGSVESHMDVYGNDSDNYMSGLYVSETYHAGAGNDEVHASNGNDILLGGEGNDKLYGDNNNDKIYGGEGNDYLHGGEGDDYLDGGTGNDYLYGSENNDTYIYRRGDGSDTIEEYDYHCNSHRSTDKLVLEDLNKEDIADIIREGYDVVIKFADTADVSGDQIRMKNWFRTDRGDGQYGGRYDRKLEVITFADGTKWGTGDIEKRTVIHGTDDADVLTGTSSNSNIYGMDGDDTITGTGGKDVIDGGKGNDTVSGGSGDDTYIFREGDGHDTVSDTSGNDTLKLETESRNVQLSRMANDLRILLQDSDDSVTVSNWFSSDNNKIEKIETSDASLTYKMAALLAQSMASMEDEKGITWTQAVNENNREVNDILAAHWEPNEEE